MSRAFFRFFGKIFFKDVFTFRDFFAIITPSPRASGSMDRASDSGSEGWGFESLLAYQRRVIPVGITRLCCFAGTRTAGPHAARATNSPGESPSGSGRIPEGGEWNRSGKARRRTGTFETVLRLPRNEEKSSATEQRGMGAGGPKPPARSIQQIFKLQKFENLPLSGAQKLFRHAEGQCAESDTLPRLLSGLRKAGPGASISLWGERFGRRLRPRPRRPGSPGGWRTRR